MDAGVEYDVSCSMGAILYTGNGTVGKLTMAQAAKNLTAVILKLGGKSPVIVSETANIPLAAKRIAWGKYFNAGQTCMCPDYALVHETVLPEFLEQFKMIASKFYNSDPMTKMARIINSKHWKRLSSLLSSTQGTIISFGGTESESELYIPPTMVTDVSLDDPLFESEIFGPILPILTFSNMTDVPGLVASIDTRPVLVHRQHGRGRNDSQYHSFRRYGYQRRHGTCLF